MCREVRIVRVLRDGPMGRVKDKVGRNKNEMFQQWIMECMGDKISIGVAGETIEATPLGMKENEAGTWILAADSIPEDLL